MEGTMTPLLIIAVLAIALVAYVWFRQERHKVFGGDRPQSPDALLENQRKHWGTTAGGGF
jgi:hypothetical protein